VALAEPRSGQQRKADTLAKLAEQGADVWVASASPAGHDPAGSGSHPAGSGSHPSGSGSHPDPDPDPRPYLVPLSLAWIDDRVVIALEAGSRTARNIVEHGTARLGLGPTRDVVIIDAALDRAVGLDELPGLAERYASQAGWDPGSTAGRYVFLLLRPDRVQAWREANELPGRTLMLGGSWVV
jgi:hypothetical protein